MKQYIPILKKTSLFTGIFDEEIEAMLGCLQAQLRTYKKGEYIFRQGEHIENISILLEGKLHIQRDDYWGNCSIINVVNVGEMFGEAYVTLDSDAIANDVVATTDSTVIFLNVNKILTVCSSACRFHTMLIKNLFYAISMKNRALVQRIGHLSRRSTREKLLSYLSDEARRNNSASFEIPFNRQQLADFLFVDRSAMSNELCKMRDEGLLMFEKNRFKLL
ncbi:MAG: Crp/Fnr family transcriptional regulator [Lachnospiraceae bacterium]|nr:Crp/Fnr family transcriptional regulator [Lachnospiraceae bacterium]